MYFYLLKARIVFMLEMIARSRKCGLGAIFGVAWKNYEIGGKI